MTLLWVLWWLFGGLTLGMCCWVVFLGVVAWCRRGKR